jgi:hypothetical protein
MAEIQQFNLGQLLGQAEQIKGARRQNRLAELMAPIQQQSAQLGLDQARLGQTQQLARTAMSILGDTPEQNWPQAIEFARQRGADLTGLEQYTPQAFEAVKQLASGAGQSRRIQSTYIDDQGQRVAIYSDGQTEILGRAGTPGRMVDGALVDPITGQARRVGGTETLTPEQIDEQRRARQQEEAQAAAAKKRAEADVVTAPSGYRLTQSGELEPVPGGPVDMEIKEAARQRAEASELTSRAAITVFEDAERALDVLDRYGSLAAGTGSILSTLPATPARTLRRHIESIQGNIGIDSLLAIKRSGAGLGAIPQAQLEMLASLMGNLDASQSPDELKFNLQRIQEIYADIVRKEGGDPIQMAEDRRRRLEGGGQQQPQQSPAGNIDSILNRYR